eukprot:3068769-Rhodomonas_salina.2
MGCFRWVLGRVVLQEDLAESAVDAPHGPDGCLSRALGQCHVRSVSVTCARSVPSFNCKVHSYPVEYVPVAQRENRHKT